MKARVYRIAMLAASIAVLVEALGAGAKWS
jgi:hypothetical protein